MCIKKVEYSDLRDWFIVLVCHWNHRRHSRYEFDTCFVKIPWRRKWQPTLVFLPGKSHGEKSLVGHRVRHNLEIERAHTRCWNSKPSQVLVACHSNLLFIMCVSVGELGQICFSRGLSWAFGEILICSIYLFICFRPERMRWNCMRPIGHKAFLLCPHLLFVGKRFQPPRPSPSSKEQTQTVTM